MTAPYVISMTKVTSGLPVLGHSDAPPSPGASSFMSVGLPVLASVLIAIGAVLSLVTIISIYHEGGVLKRLRATPLRPRNDSLPM